MQYGLMDITLEYCAPCKFSRRVVKLMEEILDDREIEAYIRSWSLIPSKGGVFELTLNGELIFSKKALGRHAEPGEVKALLVSKLEALKNVAAVE
jgi:selenoprotein W-related protein